MLIDKSKFMVLVAAIAASTAGCIINNGDGGAGGGSTSGSATGGSTSQGGGGTGGATTSTSQGGGGTGGDAQGGGGGGTGGGAACLGDTGTPDACSSMCETIIDNCASIPSLKAGVAVQVVACLNALPPSTCSAETDGWNGCFKDGLADACHDTSVEATCSTLATACTITDDAAWQTECSSNLSGMSASGRTLTTQCFTDYCGTGTTLDFCTSTAYYL